jgi:hypothetical protein
MSYIFSEFPYIFAYFLREGAGEEGLGRGGEGGTTTTTHNSLTLRRCSFCFFVKFRRLFQIVFAVMLPLSIRICSCFSMFFANPEDSGQLCRECSIFRTTLYLLLVQDEDDLLLA